MILLVFLKIASNYSVDTMMGILLRIYTRFFLQVCLRYCECAHARSTNRVFVGHGKPCNVFGRHLVQSVSVCMLCAPCDSCRLQCPSPRAVVWFYLFAGAHARAMHDEYIIIVIIIVCAHAQIIWNFLVVVCHVANNRHLCDPERENDNDQDGDNDQQATHVVCAFGCRLATGHHIHTDAHGQQW